MFPYVSTLLSQIRSVPTCSDIKIWDLRGAKLVHVDLPWPWPARLQDFLDQTAASLVSRLSVSSWGAEVPGFSESAEELQRVAITNPGIWMLWIWRHLNVRSIHVGSGLDIEPTSAWAELHGQQIYDICPKEKMIHCFTDGVSVDVSLGVELLPSWARNGQLRSASGKVHV